MDLEQLIQLLIKEQGGTKEQYHLLLRQIANHESKGDPTIHQIGGGPGRGLYQFEVGEAQGGKTAANRLKNYLKKMNKPIPQWLNNLSKFKSVDASTLTEEQQSMLLLGDFSENKNAKFSNLWSGKESVEDFWIKYHWKGKEKDEFQRRKSFKESNNGFPDILQLKKETIPKYKNLINDTLLENNKQLDNIQKPKSYKLNLNRFIIPSNIQPKTELEQPNVSRNINLPDYINNKNIAAYGGSFGQRGVEGEFNEFNSGGSHEQNPHGGVPQGIGQNGKMNTVEENETSYQFKEGKYIFSDRIKI